LVCLVKKLDLKLKKQINEGKLFFSLVFALLC
jgi:hypothetical protein